MRPRKDGAGKVETECQRRDSQGQCESSICVKGLCDFDEGVGFGFGKVWAQVLRRYNPGDYSNGKDERQLDAECSSPAQSIAEEST